VAKQLPEATEFVEDHSPTEPYICPICSNKLKRGNMSSRLASYQTPLLVALFHRHPEPHCLAWNPSNGSYVVLAIGGSLANVSQELTDQIIASLEQARGPKPGIAMITPEPEARDQTLEIDTPRKKKNKKKKRKKNRKPRSNQLDIKAILRDIQARENLAEADALVGVGEDIVEVPYWDDDDFS